MDPNYGSHDIADIARRVISDICTPGHEVVVEGDKVYALVDGPKVERMIENLVMNAVKYSPDGTRIWVKARQERDQAMICVEDEGSGVPPEFRDSIFEPFARGDKKVSHSPGTGIGLALVSKFVQLHGGTITVGESHAGGASFIIRLPSSPPCQVSGVERAAVSAS